MADFHPSMHNPPPPASPPPAAQPTHEPVRPSPNMRDPEVLGDSIRALKPRGSEFLPGTKILRR